ncbi:response regulator [Paenibacillus hemerocallicola]|uniref:Response regulator n=1 Tax=Paenibacillus hemerocallicola TaxID=1172614 RepID=A0A5C4TCC0_9BACL|nr:response regulator [Paenibacillus hemerocallicola]TNJ66256.1 response regulator [Paenibacillus hemerocallicola]
MNNVNLLIVDDEPIICRGLRETVQWEDAEVTVIGEAYDGEEALRLIAELDVDLVLTDICMPFMDGLRLAEKVKETMPHVRIVILSGYGEFEYARQAVRLGIEDFLLKPAEIPEMLGMISRIAGEIRKERRLDFARRQEQRLARIRELMLGGTEANLSPSSEPSEPHEAAAEYRFVASQIVRGAEWLDKLDEPLSPAAMECWKTGVDSALNRLGAQPLSFYYHPNVLLTLCHEQETTDERLLSERLSEIAYHSVLGEKLVFAVSATFRDLAETKRYGMSAVHLLYAATVDPDRSVRFASGADGSCRSLSSELAPDTEKRILQAFIQNDKEQMDGGIRQWITDLSARGCPVIELFRLYEELRHVVLRKMRSSGVKNADQAAEFPLAKTFDLHLYNTFETAGAFISAEMHAMMAAVQPGTLGKNGWLVERALGYIRDRSHIDLKASEVSAWLKITPSYFSVIFKQHVGCGFTEYVNGLRIDRAKVYLSDTHDRVFEIADKVGYKDYKYFVAVFKATTGVTPTEYRNLETGKVG